MYGILLLMFVLLGHNRPRFFCNGILHNHATNKIQSTSRYKCVLKYTWGPLCPKEADLKSYKNVQARILRVTVLFDLCLVGRSYIEVPTHACIIDYLHDKNTTTSS